MSRLKKLLEKRMLTQEEFEELNVLVPNIENCGASGAYYGKTWYRAILDNGEEYDIYIE